MKRYRTELKWTSMRETSNACAFAGLVEDVDGDCVLYSDIANLVATHDDLVGALEAATDLMEQEDFATLSLVPKLRAAIAKAKS